MRKINKKSLDDEIVIEGIQSELDDNTKIITMSQRGNRLLEQAMYDLENKNHIYKQILDDKSNAEKLSESQINDLANNPQSDLNKILKINNIARSYINKDDLVGKVYDTIENNVNTKMKFNFPENLNTNDKTTYEVKKQIENCLISFNEKINIKKLLRDIIPITYSEGNYIMYLRKTGKGEKCNYYVDHYPLQVAKISELEVDGDPLVLIDINDLRSRLKRSGLSPRKKRDEKMSEIDQQIKEFYPKEVYDAYINKSKIARLDLSYSGVVRINNLKREYGVTPIFRTFKPLSMLDVFDNSDKANASVKGKKIICQILRKELLGEKGNSQHFPEMAYSHENFKDSWNNGRDGVVLLSCPAYVEKVEFIETSTKETDIQTISFHRNKVLTALGISYISTDSKNSYTVAQINVEELMKTINKISEQVEEILKKWYRIVLKENGLPTELTPNVEIIDSELLEYELKLKLADVLFSKFGASYKTIYETIGLNYEDEKERRIAENEEKVEEIFSPRLTNYTVNGKDLDDDKEKYAKEEENQNEDKEKQESDNTRNNNKYSD